MKIPKFNRTMRLVARFAWAMGILEDGFGDLGGWLQQRDLQIIRFLGSKLY